MISTPAATSLSLDEASAFLGVHPNTLQQLAETLLNESDHPVAEQSVREYNHLRAVQRHLLTHLNSIKLQTESSIEGIRREANPDRFLP